MSPHPRSPARHVDRRHARGLGRSGGLACALLLMTMLAACGPKRYETLEEALTDFPGNARSTEVDMLARVDLEDGAVVLYQPADWRTSRGEQACLSATFVSLASDGWRSESSASLSCAALDQPGLHLANTRGGNTRPLAMVLGSVDEGWTAKVRWRDGTEDEVPIDDGVFLSVNEANIDLEEVIILDEDGRAILGEAPGR